MRGPKLVGYPQTGLRWSGDSARLYFEWRRPGDDEAATYVVARDGGEPRKLTDEERRARRRRPAAPGTRRIDASCSSIRATSCCVDTVERHPPAGHAH